MQGAQFVLLCRRLDLFSQSIVAIDGSKFKARPRALRIRQRKVGEFKRYAAMRHRLRSSYFPFNQPEDNAGSLRGSPCPDLR